LPPLISAQGLSKRYGAAPLFKNISFTVSEGDRIGVIGPNGSGKSTLLGILYGKTKPDSGDVAIRKGTRLSYVTQISEFQPGVTIQEVIENALAQASVPQPERAGRLAETLGRAGFTELGVPAAQLSGGWRKRLAIAEALVQNPDVLLLDEPTNHLDLAGIEWLERLLQRSSFASVVVSHDRYFLENVSNEMVEIDRGYEDGALRAKGSYSTFLEAKEEHLHAQRNRQEALENRVHTEIEWLRRGPKARATKAKARIDKAHKMIGELAEMKSRSSARTAQIDFSATDRQTKQLIKLEGVNCAIGERVLFENFNFSVTSGMRVGLVGPNGSGKTTLLRLLRGEILPAAGRLRKAAPLRVVYFDQNRELDPDLLLRRALAPDSDAVIYQDRVIHVASWAARFLFSGEDLNRRVGMLSGGERARVLIAQLMLQPADVLLLDEPTNDLDIPTLEILEESLLEFRGALVLVTHDRYMLDRASTIVLGFDGMGAIERFADYSQWEEWLESRQKEREQIKSSMAATSPGIAADATTKAPGKRKLSYQEARELEGMEERIANAEEELQLKQAELHDPAIASDGQKLHSASLKLDEARKFIDELYARWAELEHRKG
jgi:ATP-binding cassette subfamily F protein uup